MLRHISFTIRGNGFNKSVQTDLYAIIVVEGLFPARYTAKYHTIDRYELDKTHTLTINGCNTSTDWFNITVNGVSHEDVKSSEDSLGKGLQFPLCGTSLSGLVYMNVPLPLQRALRILKMCLSPAAGHTPLTKRTRQSFMSHLHPRLPRLSGIRSRVASLPAC